ncbi:MAG: hypothetical protein HOV71_27360 [Hamadaea sp.]|uniref:hypothetical protein n=1 Tax=Hamadaea sp. NPDC050747 TaxID=3155789 RepID=UPI00182A57AF|nr:hypothetical protein [Hamadaea sp.]NUR51861.1 hypothetical protein [Hamadaea sp.]NUR70886.1 hypothetical protein [Hamadaea sp.]NUT02260.1 hypothetical protein [Hamadaea sp.]
MDTTKIALQALDGYRQAATQIADGFDRAKQGLTDADVSGDSFGLLQESQGIAGKYSERCEDGLQVLTDGRTVFDALADAMEAIRDAYRSADLAAAQRYGGK